MIDKGEVRRMVLEGRGIVEISEILKDLKSIQVAKEVRLEMIEEGIPICSPFGLVQERVEKGPLHEWRIIVICCLMNKTHARQVRPMMKELFARFPNPIDMAQAGPLLEEILRPLGLIQRRAAMIRKMSEDYVKDCAPGQCFGVGDYGRESLRIFVDGDTSFVPGDKFLVKYVDWVNGGKVT